MRRLPHSIILLALLAACGGGSGQGSSGTTSGSSTSGSGSSSGTSGSSAGDAGQSCTVTGCSANQWCDAASGSCQAGCDHDAQCGANGVCDLGTHQCGCGSGYHDCSGTCAANNSVASCGQSCSACPAQANASASCDGTQCVYSCDASARSCGGGCAACPTGGVTQTGCSGSACVATACASGYLLCNGVCSACPTSGVSATTCDGSQCVASACSSGYVACGGGCSACGPGDVLCCVETVDQGTGSQGGVGRYASVGAAAGEVAIAYRDDDHQAAKVAYRSADGGSWTLDRVSGSGDQGEGTSVAVGPDGTLHAAWYDSVALTFDYGRKPPGGSWTVEPIDVTNTILTAGRTSLKLDAAGNPRVAYDADHTLWYGERDSTGWSIVEVDQVAGTDPSLALDAQGQPHITYSVSAAQQGFAFELLKYATRASGTWSTSNLFQRNGTAAATESALLVDGSGVPRVLFYDTAFFQLDQAVPAPDGGWARSTLASNVLAGGLSIAEDSAGGVHASYMDSQSNAVIYTSLVGSSWVPLTVDSAVAPELYTSLAIDASDRPYLVWWDDQSGAGVLRFAH